MRFHKLNHLLFLKHPNTKFDIQIKSILISSHSKYNEVLFYEDFSVLVGFQKCTIT